MNSGFSNEITQPPTRPQLLTVTCILTWICCALLFASSLIGLVAQPSMEKQQQQIEQLRSFNPEAADKMEEALAEQGGSSQIISQVLNIVCLGLSAFGAWWMWNLKKAGFYFYLAGEIIPYAGLFISGKAALAAVSALGSAGNAILGVAIVLMAICDLAFIIMYAVNLKHMK